MGPPLQEGALVGIVVREVVFRHVDRQALADIAAVLVAEGVAVILGVAHDEKASAVAGHAEQDAGLLGLRQDPQLLAAVNGLGGHLRIAAVGDQEIVVEAADDGLLAVADLVGVDAEELLFEELFGQAVVVVETGLGPPADMEGAGDIGLAPGEDFAELGPVVDLLILHLLYRRACDDQAVEAALPQLVKGIVKLHQVGGRHIGRLVGAHPHEGDIELEGGVGQHAQQLQLRLLLGRHQVQDADLQRTDVLVDGSLFIDHE